MSDNDNNANDQNSVSDTECLDPEVTEIMDVTEEWVDTANIDSKNLNVQGPNYIHPDIRSFISEFMSVILIWNFTCYFSGINQKDQHESLVL